MRAIVGVAGALVSLLALGACASAEPSGSDATYEKVALDDASAAGEVVKQTRAFGINMLGQQPGETVVFSPASAVIALSMLTQNSTGEADEQLAEILGADGEARDQAVNALTGALDDYRVAPADIDSENLPQEPQLHIANQIVLNKGMKAETAYLDGLKHWFDADVEEADLAAAAGKKVLDKWVDQNTAGLIKESAIEPNAELRLALQNVVLFASQWGTNFKQTGQREFTGPKGTQSADYFGATTELPYSELEDWQMIEVPYGDGKFVAQFILPPAGTDPTTIGAGQLATMQIGLDKRVVEVELPKLDIQTSLELKDPLETLGFTAVFSAQPPALRNISETEDLYVGQAVQQGRLIVDEMGTLAAAVTEIGVDSAMASDPDPEAHFIADHPFLMIIQESNTGWDLFQIAVNDVVSGDGA